VIKVSNNDIRALAISVRTGRLELSELSIPTSGAIGVNRRFGSQIILIAAHAGPAWTPLFPMLGGLVLTRAALFHHAATTAREYGLPAVINVRDATSRIPDGAWITLDGTTGEIRMEAEPGGGDIPGSGA
jgi:phosphohistidine swiveling domain-containing protein